MRGRLYPPISVHCWGGLGSQLFTLLLVNKLTAKFPRRRIRIVFHSGGVTKRLPEVLPLVENHSYKIIDDFNPEGSGVGGSKSPINIVRTFLFKILTDLARVILSNSGFLSSCDNSAEFFRTKPWVLSIRGHYSYLPVKYEFVDRMYRDARGMCTEPSSQLKDIHNSLCIHYRLGDLIALGTKAPTSPARISSVVDQVNLGYPVLVLSDSPEIAVRRLIDLNSRNEFTSAKTSTWDAILQPAGAKIFIGTSSKISYWITIIRVSLLNLEDTFMPIEDKNQLKLNLSDKNFRKVKFYES